MSYYQAHKLSIDGALLIKAQSFTDERGTFEMSYHSKFFEDAGIPNKWVQDNVSESYFGVLRGLHLQKKNPQAKLIKCIFGSVYDVILDVRPDSPTFRKWVGINLTGAESEMVYVPPGCAHGFFCQTNLAYVSYKCSELYDKESDGGIRWSSAGIDWPFESSFDPMVSMKDQLLPTLDDYLKAMD